MKSVFLAVVFLLVEGGSIAGQELATDWSAVEKTIGQKGSLQAGEVFKIGLPRYDLVVRRGDVTVHPVLGLSSWLAFKAVGPDAVVHGDLCLLEEEVNPVLSRLQQGGIEATALHNHLSGEQPRVLFLHFWGQGKAEALAATLRAAVDLTGTPRGAARPAPGALDQSAIEEVLGQAGRLNAGVLQFSIPRPFPIHMHGIELPPAMGMATALNFQPTPDGVATTGDFVVREEELAGVLRALRTAGIEVTAVHNHMVNDDPRMVFVHFWGQGGVEGLARGLRAALDTLASTR
ncbi:MAG: DUF1259 domain-containing protein [Acidobacteria bacterium]|nr:DUF1259 domain-containing protein [Acidobacteriota bacterium]